MKRTTTIESIVYLYSALFLYTGISKLSDFRLFKENIADSPILAPIATPIALGLPWVEFAITILLIIPRWRLKGLSASLILMLLFTGYVIAILLFDKHLPCSCGGILQLLSWQQHLVFNGIFLLLALWAIVLQRKEIRDRHKSWHLNKYQIMSENKLIENSTNI